VILDGENVSMGSYQVGQMDGLLLVLEFEIFHHPLDEISARENAWNFGHETFGRFHWQTSVFVLHLPNYGLNLSFYKMFRHKTTRTD